MPTSAIASSLAFFQEVTQGLGPADAAAWASSGTRIRHIAESLQLDGFKQSVLEDERSFENVQDLESKILGIKGSAEFGFDIYLTGLGSVVAANTQAAHIPLTTLLTHCMGAAHRSNATTITAGTSTTATVGATTNIALGCYVGIEDADDPGRVHLRRVTNIAGSVLTFDQALPFTVANGDTLRAAITVYFDEDILEDSSVGPTTLSWLISKGRSTAAEHWQAVGTKSYVEGIQISRNELPKLSIKTMVASFRTPDQLSDVTWAADPSGFAPVAVGPDTQVHLQTYGTTTTALRHTLELSISPGGMPAPVDTLTEVETGMVGRSHYGLTKDETTASIHTLFTNTDFSAFTAGTLRLLRWARIASAGNACAVALHRCQQVETPSNANAGVSLGTKHSYRGMRDTTTTATTDLWRTRLAIVIA